MRLVGDGAAVPPGQGPSAPGPVLARAGLRVTALALRRSAKGPARSPQCYYGRTDGYPVVLALAAAAAAAAAL